MAICSIAGCDRVVHALCYEDMLDKSNKDLYPIENECFCTITHHELRQKEQQSNAYTWTNDGADGKDDPNHSQYYLVEWLKVQGNYAKWRSPPGALTKRALAVRISAAIFEQGVKVERTAQQVQSKIETIEKSMRSARSYLTSTTGAGLTVEDIFNGDRSMDDKVCCLLFVTDHHTNTHWLHLYFT
jgi:hypothetical protein